MNNTKKLFSLDPLSKIDEKSDLFLFDTHCHLSDEDYQKEDFFRVLNVLTKPSLFGLKKFLILNVGCDVNSSIKTIKQSKENNYMFPAIGIHPNSNADLNDENISWLDKQISNNKIFAVGEIGLDYYRLFTEIDKQNIFLEKQILLAKRHNLPVLLHIRNFENGKQAFYDALVIIKKVKWFKGLVHCFSGDVEIAKEFINLGFYISFSGTITFKKNKENAKKLINSIPIEKILVETDSPYLSPFPFRGRKNFPWNAFYNLKIISEARRISLSEVSKIVFFNSLNFLNIKNF